MKREIIIEVIAYAFVILFVYAALNKWISFDFYLKDLRRSPLLGPFAIPISILVPASELIVTGLLLMQKTRRLGFIGALILMSLFTIYVGYVLGFLSEQPCSCGGIIRNMTWPSHMIFNVCFLLLAATGIVLTKKQLTHNYA